MKNLWEAALTNQDLIVKFKALVGDYLLNQDLNAFGQALNEMKCLYFQHELVKRVVLMSIEKEELECGAKLLHFLNVNFQLTNQQIALGIKSAEERLEDLTLDVPKTPELFAQLKSILTGLNLI
mmetsp:Transcript_11775/g.8578  ORF Transcript_11775/g.8578 Transcript_11775/m.8578 type:complete len:124 (-) Transcript_11775:40-411(-)